jgi:lipopolysaccharide export system permease protein
MPLIIYRYLLMEILPPFGVGILGFTSIVFLGRMMRLTQMIVVKGVGLVEVLKSCAYLLPYLLVFTLPMAATVGILLALTRLTVDHEVMALKTSGLSYLQLLPPILAFSLGIMALTLVLTVFGSPWGQQATRDLLKEVMKRRADLGLKEQAFNTEFQGLMLFVNRVSAQGQMEGVFINDQREEDNPQTIYARSGQLNFDREQETMMMNLLDGRVIRWERDENRVQTVDFKTYQLPLQLFGMKGEQSESEMSLEELRQVLAAAPPGTERHNRAMVELNQRFAMPLGALLLCLIAMPLGLSPRQHGRAYGLILGLVMFLVYYVVFTASRRLAINAQVNPSLAPWLPDALFIWVAFYLWYRTVREMSLLPASWPSWSRVRPRTARAWWGFSGALVLILLAAIVFYKAPWRDSTPSGAGGPAKAVSGGAAGKEEAPGAGKAKKKARREKASEAKAPVVSEPASPPPPLAAAKAPSPPPSQAQAPPREKAPGIPGAAKAPAALPPVKGAAPIAAPPGEVKGPPGPPVPAKSPVAGAAKAPPGPTGTPRAAGPGTLAAMEGGPPLTEARPGPAAPPAPGPGGPPVLEPGGDPGPLALATAPPMAATAGGQGAAGGGPPLLEAQEPGQGPAAVPAVRTPAVPEPAKAPAPRTRAPAGPPGGGAQTSSREERFLVIAATYFALEPARAFSQRLRDQNLKAQVVKKTLGGKTRYQVQVGPLDSAAEAEELARRLQSREKLPPPQVQKLPASTPRPPRRQ